jgi:hypothetical protein
MILFISVKYAIFGIFEIDMDRCLTTNMEYKNIIKKDSYIRDLMKDST